MSKTPAEELADFLAEYRRKNAPRGSVPPPEALGQPQPTQPMSKRMAGRLKRLWSK